ncbi:hypothetical protein CEXT_527721 [Caerostris extrusa]|uniref:Uncharacterized protein n=1 Tax=Caerostris extrusa TaxID=172846 RepID=A0AAV4UET9_CAEEX|nr:hypothetical protein CEXT_527721 [Caerostris extrusa]
MFAGVTVGTEALPERQGALASWGGYGHKSRFLRKVESAGAQQPPGDLLGLETVFVQPLSHLAGTPRSFTWIMNISSLLHRQSLNISGCMFECRDNDQIEHFDLRPQLSAERREIRKWNVMKRARNYLHVRENVLTTIQDMDPQLSSTGEAAALQPREPQLKLYSVVSVSQTQFATSYFQIERI